MTDGHVDAESFGRILVQSTPGDVAQHMRWVRALRCAKQWDLAMLLCDAAFDVDGDQHLIRLNRAYLLLERGRYKEAADDLDVAACADHPFEERLAGAAARTKAKMPGGATQAQIMREYFDPADATFDAHDFDAAAVKASLVRFGCAWIKRLFDPAALAEFDKRISSNIADIEELNRALGMHDTWNIGFPLYFAAEMSREKAQEMFRSTYPQVFDPARMNGADNNKLANFVFANLARCGLDAVVGDYLGMKPLYTSAAICHIRNFKPLPMDWFGELHQDNRLYSSDNEILTLWFPFKYSHGTMPSLEFLPLRSKSHLPCSSDCGIDNEMFAPEAFWRPHYQIGDAMLISGFVPHRTYIETHMTQDRTSIDFRMFASGVPSPIYAPEPESKAPNRTMVQRMLGLVGFNYQW